MAKHRDQEYGQALFDKLQQLVAAANGDRPKSMALASSQHSELRKMKKFRFQLLHRWLVEHFAPCRVADIGGGKGLLCYLLQHSGWQATLIDPIQQSLPDKYKDISSGKRIKIAPTEQVQRIDKPFDVAMARHFDLLVGLHAHGCNAGIIDVAAETGCGFVLFPCCVIDEPFYPRLGVQWLESVADYALYRGHTLYPFRLNFKGQNIGLCAPGSRTVIRRKNL